MNSQSFNPEIVSQLYRPAHDSHKGQNGRVLVIGGSTLFHASIFWSAAVAAKIVDLVHFTSPANENNDLVRQKIKAGFWEGIVVDYAEVEDYIREDDSILIGPGMTRTESTVTIYQTQDTRNTQYNEGVGSTAEIVNHLLKRYPEKKWVVDGGALQEVDPTLLNGNMIITPHQGEFTRLAGKIQDSRFKIYDWNNADERAEKSSALSNRLDGLTILTKGLVDIVCRFDEAVLVEGGSAGMTKGGTGDVLAGLVTALYAKNDAFLTATVASYVNKKAGEALAKRVGVYFNAGDLVVQVPKVLSELVVE
jgi:NAD(P)H-hydrate epimerase